MPAPPLNHPRRRHRGGRHDHRFRRTATGAALLAGPFGGPGGITTDGAPSCCGQRATIVAGPVVGTPWNDVIVGTPGPDDIDGGGGDDVICSFDGDGDGDGVDVVTGAAGTDGCDVDDGDTVATCG